MGIAALVAWSALALAPANSRSLRALCLVAAALATMSVPFATRVFPFRPDLGKMYGVACAALQRRYRGGGGASPCWVTRAGTRSRVWGGDAFPGEFGLVNGVAPVPTFVQDGGAGSMLLNLHDHPEIARAFFEGTVYGGAYAAHPQPHDVLVIGLGGAPDIQTALHHGAGTVTGVEINASTIELVRGPYARFLGDPYGEPNVTIEHRDGRSFVERTPHRYDIIQMTGADTYSASGAGAFMFSENYLYTIEAFRRYFGTLTDDGVLSVIRFGLEPMRVVATEIAALRLLGVAHPETHLVVLQQGMWVNVLLTRRALSQDDVARVVRAVTDATTRTDACIALWRGDGIQPRRPDAGALRAGLPRLRHVLGAPQGGGRGAGTGRARQARVQRARAQFLPCHRLAAILLSVPARGQLGAVLGASGNGSPVNYATNYYTRGLRAYFGFLAVIALVAAALILLPLAVAKRRELWGAAPARALGYFTALGLGYLFVELTLMQKSALFLGHPTYSIAVTLLTLLLAWAWERVRGAAHGTRTPRGARGGARRRGPSGGVRIGLHPLFVALLPAPSGCAWWRSSWRRSRWGS